MARHIRDRAASRRFAGQESGGGCGAMDADAAGGASSTRVLAMPAGRASGSAVGEDGGPPAAPT